MKYLKLLLIFPFVLPAYSFDSFFFDDIREIFERHFQAFDEDLKKAFDLENLEEMDPFDRKFLEKTRKFFDFDKWSDSQSKDNFNLSQDSLGTWEETEKEKIYSVKVSEDKNETVTVKVENNMLTVIKTGQNPEFEFTEMKSLPLDVDPTSFDIVEEDGLIKVKFKKLSKSSLSPTIKKLPLKRSPNPKGKSSTPPQNLHEKNDEPLGPYGTEKMDLFSKEQSI